MRPFLTIASLSAVFGACRALRGFFAIFLRQDSGEAFLSAFARNLDWPSLLASVFGWTLLGLTLASVVALALSASGRRSFREAVLALAPAYLVLLVPAALTAMSLLALVVSPLFPYGSNLTLSLLLEGSFQSWLVAGLFAASLANALFRLVEPRTAPVDGTSSSRWPRRLWLGWVAGLALCIFITVTPNRFYVDGAGQGNMFKYLRMAAAVAHAASLDISKAEGAEESTVGSFIGQLPGFGSRYVRASVELARNIAGSLAEGELYLGTPLASRANRSMFRSLDGGVYYINAPGPGLLLVPAYLIDRSLNRWFGWDRQYAVLLFWNLVGVLLVLEMMAIARPLGGEAAATLLAFGVALSTPVLFYTFQVYPELPGALFLLFAFRKLIMEANPSARGVLFASLALAFLPWLHQKYSVVAAVVALSAGYKLWRTSSGKMLLRRRLLLLLFVPLAISAYSIFLYNHALTGSLSPTATFHAAGRSSFEPHNALKGMVGLLFDRENGLFLFAPIFLLALVGARALYESHRHLFPVLALTLASYLVVIASFPYWPGAVSTMGRYISSALPLLALPMVLVVHRSFRDGVLAGVALVLLAGTLAYSTSFTRDLVPSYHANLLWSRALYSDPMQYTASLLSPGWLGSGPAHFAKLFMMFVITGSLVLWLQARVREPRPDADGQAFVLGLTRSVVVCLVALSGCGLVLEHWPSGASTASKPQFRETRELSRERELGVIGKHGFERGGVWVPGGGTTRFVLVAQAPASPLRLSLTNGPRENRVMFHELRDRPIALPLAPDETLSPELTLRKPYRFQGPEGTRYVYEFTIQSKESFVPAEEGRGEDQRRLGTYVRVR